jgi:hypothetical protein
MRVYSVLISMMVTSLLLESKSLELGDQQIADWQIKTAVAKGIKSLPLGKFMAEVVTPPKYLYSVTLPFEAQIKGVTVAKYDNIRQGQLLATVTGHDWIKIQQQFIQDSIELQHHEHVAERKNRLCNEDIIPKKQCLAANAEYQADKIKMATAKALLRGYGADEGMIERLVENLEISQSIPIYSKFSGKLLKVNVGVGRSTQPSEALFVIQKRGSLWLEADLLVKSARALKDRKQVTLKFSDERFKSRVLLHAPHINVENQTQKVRFSLPNNSKFLTGLRDMLEIILPKKALKVLKKSVISLGGEEVVFVKNSKGFEPVAIKVLGEDKRHYFIKETKTLHQPIVQTSVAILKIMIEGEDE